MADKKADTTTQADIDKNKTMAILAYFIFFLPLLTDAKDSTFAKFHANQALLVWLVGVVSWFLTATLFGAIIGLPLSLVAFVLWIIGLMGAVNGQMKRLPVIGGIDIIK